MASWGVFLTLSPPWVDGVFGSPFIFLDFWYLIGFWEHDSPLMVYMLYPRTLFVAMNHHHPSSSSTSVLFNFLKLLTCLNIDMIPILFTVSPLCFAILYLS